MPAGDKEVDWKKLEQIANFPDFNNPPLDGESSKEILAKWGVHARVLGPWSTTYLCAPVVVAGDGDKVGAYIKHLTETLPKD